MQAELNKTIIEPLVEKRGFIYCLRHPITEEMRYIGQTISSLHTRLQHHIRNWQNENGYKANWIGSLSKKNLKPTINLLEECLVDELDEREMYYISKCRDMGLRLTNIKAGGSNSRFIIHRTWDEVLGKEKADAWREQKRKAMINNPIKKSTPINEDEVERLYKEGMTINGIAKLLKCRISRIADVINKLNIRKPKISLIEKNILLKYYINEKIQKKDLCKLLNVSRSTIDDSLSFHNIKKNQPKLDRDLLFELYINQNMSSKQIANKLGFSKFKVSSDIEAHKIKKTECIKYRNVELI